MKNYENPYLEISAIVHNTFNELTDQHLEVIFNVKFFGKTNKECNEILSYCRNKWDELSWNEIMEILNDIYN